MRVEFASTYAAPLKRVPKNFEQFQTTNFSAQIEKNNTNVRKFLKIRTLCEKSVIFCGTN